MNRLLALSLSLTLFSVPEASAFCGFYVGKADSKLFNKASQVVLVRDGDRTVVTMANDYRGALSEFALVVPVPVVLKKEQIHIGDSSLLARLDAYSAPRLVEYSDPDPCRREFDGGGMRGMSAAAGAAGLDGMKSAARAKALGVTIEAQYTVGEYDILILGAKQSDGLETWLRENGYRIPKGASAALAPYIQQKIKFFVAKVNLQEQAKTGSSSLRPLQFAYEDPRFMLPIRLGMINADGPQDLILYVLTRNGRVEATNYRTVKVPTGMDIPEYVKDEFAPFYKSLFEKSVAKEDRRAVFTEYFWDMGWCDPCSADPLSREELRKAGVFWLGEDGAPQGAVGGRSRFDGLGGMGGLGGGVPVKLTRLHVRYDAEHFPEDLVFQETPDTANFQSRYVMRHPWKGDASACSAAAQYLDGLEQRRETQAETLADLTGWDLKDIRSRMDLSSETAPVQPWYKEIFR